MEKKKKKDKTYKTNSTKSGKMSDSGSKSAQKQLGEFISKKKKKSKGFRILAAALAFVFVVSGGVYGYAKEKETLWFSYFYDNVIYPIFNKPPVLDGDYMPAKGELSVHFVDVGQGDAIIVEFPNGKNMIIDGGPAKSKGKLHAYINYLNIEKFDYLMLTHSDEDHCGGLVSVIEKYPVGMFFVPNIKPELIKTVVYKDFVNAMNSQVTKGSKIEYSTMDVNEEDVGLISVEYGYSFWFITPLPGDYSRYNFSTAAQKNSISPIVILEFGSFKIMFTGDATSKESEAWFLQEVRNSGKNNSFFDVDVLKVAHHGGKDSTSKEFLEIVKAEVFAISVGAKNTYGHPSPDLLGRLLLSPVTYNPPQKRIYRTDLEGDIQLNVDTDGVQNWKTAA